MSKKQVEKEILRSVMEEQKRLTNRDLDETVWGLFGGFIGLLTGNELGVNPGLAMIVGFALFAILTMVFNHVVRVQKTKHS